MHSRKKWIRVRVFPTKPSKTFYITTEKYLESLPEKIGSQAPHECQATLPLHNGGLFPNNGRLFGDKGTLLEKRKQAGQKTLS